MAEHREHLALESADESAAALMPIAPSHKIPVARGVVAVVGMAACLAGGYVAGSTYGSSQGSSLRATIGLPGLPSWDGCWKSPYAPAEVQEVKGHVVIWEGGQTTPVAFVKEHGQHLIEMRKGPSFYTGNLKDGTLGGSPLHIQWSDGDTWQPATGCDKDQKTDPIESKGPLPRDLKFHELQNDMRAKGFQCTDGTRFPPANKDKWDCRLWKASKLHAMHLQTYPFMGGDPIWRGNPHTNPKGEDSDARARQQGYMPNTRENIIMGWPAKTVAEAFAGFKSSPAHCKNQGRDGKLHAVAFFQNMVVSNFGDAYDGEPDRSCLPKGSDDVY